jgi:hypothetical protein
LKLTPLTKLGGKIPLMDGRWNEKAEETLLSQFEKS